MPASLRRTDSFVDRHIGPDEADIKAMLKTVGLGSLEELIDSTVPSQIRLSQPLRLPVHRSNRR